MYVLCKKDRADYFHSILLYLKIKTAVFKIQDNSLLSITYAGYKPTVIGSRFHSSRPPFSTHAHGNLKGDQRIAWRNRTVAVNIGAGYVKVGSGSGPDGILKQHKGIVYRNIPVPVGISQRTAVVPAIGIIKAYVSLLPVIIDFSPVAGHLINQRLDTV